MGHPPTEYTSWEVQISILTRPTHPIFLGGSSAISLLTCLVAMLFGLSFPAIKRGDGIGGHKGQEPTWVTSLRPVGYDKPASWSTSNGSYSWPTSGYERIGFSGDNLIVVSFLTLEGPENGPRRVHAALMDSRTGQVIRKADWTTLRSEVGLLATQDGKLIVRTRQKFTLFSSLLEPITEFPLRPARKSIWEDWSVWTTPSRKSLIVVHYLGPEMEVQWLSPDTLAVSRTWKSQEGMFGLLSKKDYRLSVSDGEIIAARKQTDSSECEILIRTIEGPWRKMPDSESKCGEPAQLIADNTLLVPRGQEFLLVGTDGRVMLHQILNRSEMALYGRSSANGKRVVIPIVESRGGVELLDIAPHLNLKKLMVFDVPDGRLAFTLDGRDVKLKNLSGFALSPDGLRLAVLREAAVEVYQLPAYQ